MLQGKTKSGFNYEVAEEQLNNYELLEAIGEIDDNPLAISKVVNLLLGKEKTKELKDHVRKENGIVPVDKLTDEITEIFESHKEVKNS